MNQTTQARRKLFEEWYVADVRENTGFEITVKEVEKRRGDKGDYIDYPAMHGKWVGFNGALDSVVVQMPNRFDYSNPDAAGAAIYDTATAIKAAGVRVRP